MDRVRAVYDRRRKLMVELMREVGFGIPVMPQGAFYVFADASRWTDDSYAFAFELLEKAGVGVAPGVDFSYPNLNGFANPATFCGGSAVASAAVTRGVVSETQCSANMPR